MAHRKQDRNAFNLFALWYQPYELPIDGVSSEYAFEIFQYLCTGLEVRISDPTSWEPTCIPAALAS